MARRKRIVEMRDCRREGRWSEAREKRAGGCEERAKHGWAVVGMVVLAVRDVREVESESGHNACGRVSGRV